jgi:hypothetical protein
LGIHHNHLILAFAKRLVKHYHSETVENHYNHSATGLPQGKYSV